MYAPISAENTIVETLLDAKVISGPELSEARYEAIASGLPVVDILVQRDVLSDADVAQAYAKEFGLRYLDLTRRPPETGWVLSMPENMARRVECIVFGEVSGQLIVAVADPVNPAVAAAVTSRFDRPAQYVISPRYQIREIQDRIYGDARHKGQRMVEQAPIAQAVTYGSASGINVVEELDSIIDEAVDRRASDIHLECERDRVRVRIRVDGRLVEARSYPTEVAQPMVARVKVMATLDITERRRPQDGRFHTRSFDQNLDVRVAVIPTVHGERVTLRLLALNRANVDLEMLGMSIGVRQGFERLIHKPHGIILITGPTGSGKSTTLYAGLRQINQIDKHIITIEDPVEYNIAGVNQVQVDAEYGVSFPAALRSIVRHDPDVIMVGEIRDQETAHLALEASLTGHLVFATLHTNSAVGSITRLLDMGCEPYLVASSLIGLMAQRLVRRICPNCSEAHLPNETERRILNLPPEQTEVKIHRGKGCARCGRSGYFDRIGIYEFVPFESALGDLIMDKATEEELQQCAIASGAITLRGDAFTKVLNGQTTLEEALRVTTEDSSDDKE